MDYGLLIAFGALALVGLVVWIVARKRRWPIFEVVEEAVEPPQEPVEVPEVPTSQQVVADVVVAGAKSRTRARRKGKD